MAMKKAKRPILLTVLAALSLGLSGCPQSSLTAAVPYGGPAFDGIGKVGPGSPMAAPQAGAVGVNVGGAQDIGYARELIAQGQVPDLASFQAEGLYAEHDLPVATAPAGKTLHLALGLGIAPALPTGKQAHFVQVGLGSGLSEQDLQRPRLKLAVVADTSGSMSEQNKIAALHQALHQLVGKLKEGDEIALIDFDDDVQVLKPLGPVGDKAALAAMIDKMDADGGTDIELGLQKGYEMLSQVQEGAGEDRRLILLTDAVPTAGRTDAYAFESQVKHHADQGIGLTAFGIGLDFGASLAETIGTQRGGNYVFLRGPEEVKSVFDENFDFLMMPAAYDVEMSITPGPGFKIVDAYGVNNFSKEQGVYEIKVKTLFFSKNRGAIMLRLEETEPGAAGGAPVIAKGTLKYVERDGTTPVSDTIEAAATGDTPAARTQAYFAPAPVQKAVALTNMYLAMREATTLYHASKKSEAQAVAQQAVQQLEAARAALKDDALMAEIQLMTKLAANCAK